MAYSHSYKHEKRERYASEKYSFSPKPVKVPQDNYVNSWNNKVVNRCDAAFALVPNGTSAAQSDRPSTSIFTQALQKNLNKLTDFNHQI